MVGRKMNDGVDADPDRVEIEAPGIAQNVAQNVARHHLPPL